jgi:hypothetical protein
LEVEAEETEMAAVAVKMLEAVEAIEMAVVTITMAAVVKGTTKNLSPT